MLWHLTFQLTWFTFNTYTEKKMFTTDHMIIMDSLKTILSRGWEPSVRCIRASLFLASMPVPLLLLLFKKEKEYQCNVVKSKRISRCEHVCN